MPIFLPAFLLYLTLFSFALASEQTFTAKVIGISDGDTITVLKDHSQIKIRLHGIDCPEKNQAFGTRAKQFASDMAFGKSVTVKAMTTDRYGRTVAWIYVDGKSLNEEIVRAGMAWHYKKYSSDSNLAEAELDARKNKAGLWSDPHAVAPWEFRHPDKTSQVKPKPVNPGKSGNPGMVYHGNAKSRIFHQPECQHYTCKNCTTVLTSRDEAVGAGYRPCGICRP